MGFFVVAGREVGRRLGSSPTWFNADLPSFPLDGELWLERQVFQRTFSNVRRHEEPTEWRSIRYVVFDVTMLAALSEARPQSCLMNYGDTGRFADVRREEKSLSRQDFDQERVTGLEPATASLGS